MIDNAIDARGGWQRGEIDRYSVVPRFLDNMFNSAVSSSPNNISIWNDVSISSKLNVITTARHPGWWPRLSMEIRQPTSVEDLRTLLMQTTWIPFAVGRGLWHFGHMDGGLTMWHHPKCIHKLGLPYNLDLLFNALNINMAKEKAENLWDMGLDYGL